MRVLLAIPVFNEETYLPRVLPAVRRQISDILVIDDGSTDRTAAILRRFPEVAVIRHPENRGYGQSLIDAFAFAARKGYDWVITFDCDEQHEPATIGRFIDLLGRSDADVLSGSRYLPDSPVEDTPPADRLRINRTINELLSQILGLTLSDSFCGFKAHRVKAMSQLRLTEPGYAFPMQFWVQCVRAGLRIREVPVRLIYRDKSREFGGTLDDPSARLQHYLEVFVNELRSDVVQPACRPTGAACQATQPRP